MPKTKEQKKKDREKRVHAKKIAGSTAKPAADVAVSAQDKALGPKLRVDLHSPGYEKLIPKAANVAARKRGGI